MGILAYIKTTALPLLYFGGLTVVVLLSLSGKINLSLLFLIPLFPLQNVIERLHQFPLGTQFIDIILIAIIIGWFSVRIHSGQNIFSPTPFNALLIIMGVYTFFSLLRGSWYLHLPALLSLEDQRVKDWKNYMIFPLLFFITVNNIKSVKQIKWLIWAMLFSIVIMDYYTGNQIKWMPEFVSREKIDGTFVWAGVNVVAAFYAEYIFILLGIFLIYKQKIYRIIFGILIWVGIYIVLSLYSRGAYLALFAGFLVISLLRKRIFLIPLILLLIFWQTILPPKVVARINQTKTEEGTLDSSSTRRIDVWKSSIELVKDNPVTGIGFNVFQYLPGYELGDTHNIFIKILLEQGVIGFFIFLILFWLVFIRGWHLYRKSNDTFLKGLGLGFIACLAATIVANFFGDRWTYPQIGAYFWVFLALVERGNLLVLEQASIKNNRKK